MLFQKRKDIIFPVTNPAGTGAQTIRFIVKQERRRLEGFTFRLTMLCAATAATGAAWGGYPGIVKEIRLVVNDGPGGGGQRNVVQVTGPACLSYCRQIGLNLDRNTQALYGAGGFPSGATTEVTMFFYVPLRHPGFQEPFGNVLSFPLSSTYSANDATIEIDLYDIAASGTVFLANPPTYATTNPALVQTHLVEIPDSFPYIRSEFRTDTGFASNATANVPYEFTSGGFLTGFLLQGFSAALGNAVTRAGLVNINGQMRIEYGREVLMRTDEPFQTALNDISCVHVYPNFGSAVAASSQLDNRMFPWNSTFIRPHNGETFFDFLTDMPGMDAFSLASLPDLNPDSLGGDKFRLVFNDLASTTRPMHITYHKLLSPRAAISNIIDGFAKRNATA